VEGDVAVDELNQPSEYGACPQGGEERRHLRGLLRLLRAHKGTLAGILAASLALNLLGLAAPRCTQVILDRLVPAGDLERLGRLVVALTLITALQVFLTVWRRLTLVRLSLKLDRILLGDFCRHLLALPAAFFRSSRAGDLVARFTDHGHVRHLVTGSLTRAAIDSAMVLVYFGVLFHYSTPLAGLVTGLLLVFAGFTLLTGPVLKRRHRRLTEDRAAGDSQLIEALAHVEVIKAMGLEGAVHRRWVEALRRASESNEDTQRLRQLLESGGSAIQFLSTAAVVWYGAVLVVRRDLSVGELVAFSMYAAQALPPLLSLVTLWDEWQQARVALERIQEVLEQPPEDPGAHGRPLAGTAVRGQVAFDRVVFRYDDAPGPPVLRGLSFEIRPGEHVALVGASGSGKTTVARLLLGLYRPTAGRVLIDGQDLRTLNLAAYRRHTAVVPQENLLLSGTVAENIALGDPRPDEGRVVEAAKQAGAHDFITAMPRGYATRVGEMGLTLSGGQRQRVGLARALYRRPAILVLDEATSNLDPQSGRQVRERLRAVLRATTVLVIAHDLEAVRHVDRILVLRDGVVGEVEGYEALWVPRDGHGAQPFTRGR
jgi:ATP-binding cassette subfamily B protein